MGGAEKNEEKAKLAARVEPDSSSESNPKSRRAWDHKDSGGPFYNLLPHFREGR